MNAVSESADSIGKVIFNLEALVGQHVTTIEEGIIRTCDRLSALERQSAERIATLDRLRCEVMTEFNLCSRERACSESALAEACVLLRDCTATIHKAAELAGMEPREPTPESLGGRVAAFIQQHNNGGGGNG